MASKSKLLLKNKKSGQDSEIRTNPDNPGVRMKSGPLAALQYTCVGVSGLLLSSKIVAVGRSLFSRDIQAILVRPIRYVSKFENESF